MVVTPYVYDLQRKERCEKSVISEQCNIMIYRSDDFRLPKSPDRQKK